MTARVPFDSLQIVIVADPDAVSQEVEDEIADAFTEAIDLLKLRLRPLGLEVEADF